jgi:hypothetical protein
METFKLGDTIEIPVNEDGKRHAYRLVEHFLGGVVLQHLETQGQSSLQFKAKDINNITKEEMLQTHGLIGKKFHKIFPIVKYRMQQL